MRQTQRDALNTKLAIAAVALLALNTVLLVVLLVRQGSPTVAPASSTASLPSSPSTSAPSITVPTTATNSLPTSPSEPSAPTGGASSLETVLMATVEPLGRAADDFGIDPATVMPSDVELQAAIASGSLESAASKAVIEMLRVGYEAVNMPFPELEGNLGSVDPSVVPEEPGAGPAPTPSDAAPSSDDVAPAPTEGPAPTVDPTLDRGQRDILRAFFSVTTDRLAQQAKQQDKLAEVSLPTDAEIEAAAATGALESEACQALLIHMRAQYQRVGLEFPEPVF